MYMHVHKTFSHWTVHWWASTHAVYFCNSLITLFCCFVQYGFWHTGSDVAKHWVRADHILLGAAQQRQLQCCGVCQVTGNHFAKSQVITLTLDHKCSKGSLISHLFQENWKFITYWDITIQDLRHSSFTQDFFRWWCEVNFFFFSFFFSSLLHLLLPVCTAFSCI